MVNPVIDKLLEVVKDAEKQNKITQRELAPFLFLWQALFKLSSVVLFYLLMKLGSILASQPSKVEVTKVLSFLVIDLLLISLFGNLISLNLKKLPNDSEAVCVKLKQYLNDNYWNNESKVIEFVMAELSSKREDTRKKFEGIIKIITLLPMLFFTTVLSTYVKNLLDGNTSDLDRTVIVRLFILYLLSRFIYYIFMRYIREPDWGRASKESRLYRYLSIVKYNVLENHHSKIDS